jgi:glycosyltransferase involved in cell wall biosynthesis
MNSNNIMEFLVIDGGSTDGTQKLFQNFQKKMKNLKE